jgi:hypothetical protein
MEAKEINETVEATETQSTQPQPQQQVAIPENLNQQQALQVLVDAARVAQAKGIFTLDDAELVNKAIRAFMPPAGPVPSQG